MLLILIIASVVAIILNPIVKRFERVAAARSGDPAVYVGGFAILDRIGVLLANPVSTQVDRFADNVPQHTQQANHDLDNLQQLAEQQRDQVQIEQQGQTALVHAAEGVKSSGDIVSFSRGLLTSS